MPNHIMCIGWPTIKRLAAGEALWFEDLECGAVAADDLHGADVDGMIAARIGEYDERIWLERVGKAEGETAWLQKENAALREMVLNPDPDMEPDNIRLHREKCDALEKLWAALRERDALRASWDEECAENAKLREQLVSVKERAAKLAEEGVDEMEREHAGWRRAFGENAAQPYDDEIRTRKSIAAAIRALTDDLREIDDGNDLTNDEVNETNGFQP
jgi:hypothetical protein